MGRTERGGAGAAQRVGTEAGPRGRRGEKKVGAGALVGGAEGGAWGRGLSSGRDPG